MDHTCQHCGELIVGNAYRVTSEDQGITLLDMVVCSLCFMEAKRLHLHAEEINIRSKQPSARNRGSHQSLDLAFTETAGASVIWLNGLAFLCLAPVVSSTSFARNACSASQTRLPTLLQSITGVAPVSRTVCRLVSSDFRGPRQNILSGCLECFLTPPLSVLLSPAKTDCQGWT